MAIDRIPIKENPQLFDKAIAEIQRGLADNLGWLNHSFGRAERLVKMVGTKRVYTPNVYVNGNDYLPLSPDSTLGNFSFFVLDDPQKVDWQPGIQGSYNVPFSLIVWFDLRRVYNAESNRNTEYLKAQILRVLDGRGGWHLTDGHILTTRIYEQNENIYRGFNISEIDNQYLMHPFGGFRIDGILEYDELCITE